MMERTDKDRLVWNIPEVGSLLGISRGTAYQLAQQGVIPTIRLGKRLVVPRVSIAKLLGEAGNKTGTRQDQRTEGAE